MRGGRAGEGVEHLRESVQLNPRNATVQFHLGVAEREVGNEEAAAEAFRGALALGEFPERQQSLDALEELGAVSP